MCSSCFEDIPFSADNPTLICPKCGTENRPAAVPPAIPLSARTAPSTPQLARSRESEPGKRKLTPTEKTVLWFIAVPAALMLLATLGNTSVTRAQMVLSAALWSLGTLIYFFPALIGKHSNNAQAILILNLFLGWTLVGWVVALVWAAAKPRADEATPETHAQCPDCAELVRREARVCKHCGYKLNPG